AVSQYVGSAVAVLLFASVPAAGVAWLRVLGAAAALLAWRRPWRGTWDAPRLRLVAAFGAVLGLMNLSFYLAIARLPLGTAVAIEFAGPIAVAALGSRTRRDAGALALALAGVLLLADVHVAGTPLGVALAPAAGALRPAALAAAGDGGGGRRGDPRAGAGAAGGRRHRARRRGLEPPHPRRLAAEPRAARVRQRAAARPADQVDEEEGHGEG